jgi:hypothetical protein
MAGFFFFKKKFYFSLSHLSLVFPFIVLYFIVKNIGCGIQVRKENQERKDRHEGHLR